MRTHYVASIPLDRDRLSKELELTASFHWSEAYSEYLFGGPWKSFMLWACGGDAGDGIMTNYAYDQPSSMTGYGQQLPYMQELITTTVDLTRLQFVRLAKVANSVILPHRDLLEFTELPEDAKVAHRVHIPLATNADCFFSEGNTIYRMREGEIWYLDATQMHSVAALSHEPRFHLIFDFVDKPGAAPLVTVPDEGEGAGIPASRTVARPPLPDADRADLLRLADVVTMDNFSEVFSIVIKKHYRFDGGDNFVWNTMTTIARDSKDSAVLPHILELHRYYTLERSA